MPVTSQDVKSDALSCGEASRVVEFLWRAIAEGRMSREDAFALAAEPALVRAAEAETGARLIALLAGASDARNAGASTVLGPIVHMLADALNHDGKHADVLPLFEALQTFFTRHSLPAAAAASGAARGRALLWLGRHAEAAAVLAVAEPDLAPGSLELAYCRAGRGDALAALGRAAEAVSAFEGAEGLYDRLGRTEDLARSRLARAQALMGLNRGAEAMHAFDACEPTFRALNRPFEMGLCQLNRGRLLAAEKGREDDALAAHVAAAQFFASASPQGVAQARLGEADLLFRLRRHAEALLAFEAAEPLVRAHDAPRLAACLEWRGRTLASLHRAADAKAAYREAQELYRAQGDGARAALCDRLLGDALAGQGDHAAALARYQAGARGAEEHGRLADAALCLRGVGNEHYRLLHFAEAAAAYQQAEAKFMAAGLPLRAAGCCRDRVAVLRETERYDDALEACEAAAAVCANQGAELDVALCRHEKAKIFEEAGRLRDGLFVIDQVLCSFDGLGRQDLSESAHVTRTRLLVALGQSQEALAAIEARPAATDVRLDLAGAFGARVTALWQVGRMADVDALLKQAEAEAKQQGQEHQIVAMRQLVQSLRGRPEATLSACEAAEAVMAADGRLIELARSRVLRGFLLTNLGRYGEAWPVYEGAEAVFSKLGMAAEAAQCRIFCASVLLELGRHEEGLAACASALAPLRALGRRDIVALGTMYAAAALGGLERYDEALEAIDESRRLFASLGRQLMMTLTLNIRAQLLSRLGRHEEALQAYEETERAQAAAGLLPARALTQMGRAETLLHCGRPRQAIEVYLRIDRTLVNDDALVDYYNGLGRAYFKAGLRERGLEQFTELRRAVRRSRRVGGIDETHLEFVAARTGMVHTAAHHALALGRFELAFDAVQDSKAGVFGDLRRRLPRDPCPETEEIRDIRAQLTDWLNHSHEHERDDRSYWDEVGRRAEAYLRAWRQVRPPAPATPELDDPVRLRDVQAALPEGWALIDFWRNDDEDFRAFIVTRTSLAVETLRFPIMDPILAERINALIRAVENAEPWEDGILDDLYQHLFEPLRPRLTGLTGLYLVPHGVLHALPLHAARRRAEGRTVYLGDEFTVAYLPSASLLPQLPPLRRGGAVLSWANPERGTPRSLPFADWESAELQRRLPVGVRGVFFRGKEATLGSTEQWGEASLLHFSCHGMGEERLAALSRLRLADGMLLAHDVVYRRPPLAEGALVVLSGCETAARDWRAVDEAMGLMSAFLLRGAGLVLATQWSVEDASAAELAATFVSEVQKGAAPAEALRVAQRRTRALGADQVQARERELLRQYGGADPAGAESVRRRGALRNMRRSHGAGTGPYEHPMYWAAFQLVGRVT